MFTLIIYAGGIVVTHDISDRNDYENKWYCSNVMYVDLARISVKCNLLDCVFKHSVIIGIRQY